MKVESEMMMMAEGFSPSEVKINAFLEKVENAVGKFLEVVGFFPKMGLDEAYDY